MTGLWVAFTFVGVFLLGAVVGGIVRGELRREDSEPVEDVVLRAKAASLHPLVEELPDPFAGPLRAEPVVPPEPRPATAKRGDYEGRHRTTCGTLAQQYAAIAAEQRQVHEAWRKPTAEWPKVDDAALKALLDADRLVVAT